MIMKNGYSTGHVDDLVQGMQPLARRIESNFAQGVSIYGAGLVGTWAGSYLKSLGVEVSNFIDRDPNKIGGTIDGIPVVAPTSDAALSAASMLIAARHAVKEVERDMAHVDCAKMSFDGYFTVRNYERLAAVRDGFFSDGKSVETFNALLAATLTSTLAPCRAVMEKDMYFGLPEFSGTFDEVFVDAGAFVGDSVERFIWENLGTFRHIYAFEPGEKQFRALESRLRRLAEEWAFDPSSVSLVKGGLSSREEDMACTFVNDSPLRHGLAPASPADGGDHGRARVFSLDHYLGGRPVTFIKADIEGMEMEMLRGAQDTIRRYKPKMALCVYHYPSDLYEVAEYVRALVPSYKFKLRLHAPIFGDYVLYCCTEESF